jgi:5-hydroxyisourate hydrolase
VKIGVAAIAPGPSLLLIHMKKSLWLKLSHGLQKFRRRMPARLQSASGWLLAQDALRLGRYEMLYQIGAYFRAAGFPLAEPPFIDEVCLRFSIADAAAHYHVPLLVSPYGYTTYRGS